jgi:hypothetical protein
VRAPNAGLVKTFLTQKEDFARTKIDQGKQPNSEYFLVNDFYDSTASTELILIFHRR